MNCTRCNQSNKKLLFLSVFNDEQICVSCKEKEEKHPMYKNALEAYNQAEKNEQYNFKGIGLPKELKNSL